MKEFIKENKNQLLIWTYVIILAVVVLNYLSVIAVLKTIISLLSPLFYAIGIAFVINIPMMKVESCLKKVGKENQRWQKSIRSVALLITLILTCIVVYITVAIVLPKVFLSLESIFSNFGQFINSSIRNVNTIFNELNIDFKLEDISFFKELQNISWQNIFSQALNVLGGLADGVISNVLIFTDSFLQGFLSFCLSIYLLTGKEKFLFQLRKVTVAFLSKKRSQRVFQIASEANEIFTKFIGGQLVDCIIKGVMFYVVFLLLGYPMPELMAIIIGVCSIVPVFGPITAMVIDFVLLLALEPSSAIWFIIIFQVLSNLESNIIYPKIVGNSIGLPGIWVLLSIFVLGDVYGILGMVFAVPVTALLYTLFKEFVNERIMNRKIDVEMIVDSKKSDI